MNVVEMKQMTVVEQLTDDLADRILTLDGVVHVVVMDQRNNVVVNRAKDVDVSETVLNSFRDAAMRLSTIRTATNAETDPVGTFRLALLEYDRVAMLLLPVEDRSVGITLLKEHATAAFLDHVKTFIANARTS